MNLVISVGCGMMVVSRQSSRHKMWTEITRRKYEREGQRYASDVTDAEWALIEPHMPAVKRLGRPRETELRAVLPDFNSALELARNPGHDQRDKGRLIINHGAALFEKINFALLLEAREAAGREPSPSAGVDLMIYGRTPW